MKASDATSNHQKNEKRQVHGATFAKVLDGRKQPIRGLWIRGSRYYARLRLNVENPLTGIKKKPARALDHQGWRPGSNGGAGCGRHHMFDGDVLVVAAGMRTTLVLE